MSRTIGDVVSRIKGIIKGSKQDAFLTDRFVYSLVLKYAKLMMRRQDSRNKLMKFNPVFEILPFVELIEIDKIEAQCSSIESNCKIYRTKFKLPTFFEGYWGPLIRTVSSIDGSTEIQITYPSSYMNIRKQRNYKYNNTKYCWFINGYLYFPDTEWGAVRIEGVFEQDISKFNCNCEGTCIQAQNRSFNVPDFLDADIDKMVLQDLGIMVRLPDDEIDDKRNLNR